MLFWLMLATALTFAMSEPQQSFVCSFVASLDISMYHPEWGCDANKVPQTDPCTWSGIECIDGTIVKLELDDLGLVGTLPFWQNASSLQYISLFDHSIAGTIPDLSPLLNITYLRLGSNSLTGPVPSSLGNLSTLQYLHLDDNSLTGQLPTLPMAMARLEYLGLASNRLNGPLPNFSMQFPALKSLHLNKNRFTGTIPGHGFGTVVEDIELQENRLSGTIPPSFSSLSRLHSLRLQHNNLVGNLPELSTGLSVLQYLDVSMNSLSGSVPSSWGGLPSLYELDVSSNSLIGPLPESFCGSRLTSIDISANLMTCIPSCVDGSVLARSSENSTDHCVDGQDIALCDLSYALNIREIIDTSEVILSTDIYESEHPRIKSVAADGNGTVVIPIAEVGARRYALSFDERTLLQCPFEVLEDDCSTLITSFSGDSSSWPGVGQNGQYNLPVSSFCVKVNNMFCGEGNLYEWGYSFTVTAYGDIGTGWECSAVPNTTAYGEFSVYAGAMMYAQSPCIWLGVTCDSQFKVVTIDLRAVGISGTIPSSVSRLTALENFDLSYNFVRNVLPSTNMNALDQLISIDLTNNLISGSIPDSWSSLNSLTELSLSVNSLEGSLPSFVGNFSSLRKLSLKANRFSGKVESELCGLLERNASLFLTNNALLTCYEACFEGGDVDFIFGSSREISECTPTGAPTSIPSSSVPSNLPSAPSAAPSFTEASAAQQESVTIPDYIFILGIVGFFVIIAALVLVVCKLNKKSRLVSPEEQKKRMDLDSFPLHKAIYLGEEVDLNMAELYLESAKEEWDGLTAFQLIYSRPGLVKVSQSAIFLLVDESLPIDKETGAIFPPQEMEPHHHSWSQLVEKDDECSVAVVEAILNKYRKYAKSLADVKHSRGRKCLDIASVRCHELINSKMFLHRSYDLEPKFKHRSATCEVYIATYHPIESSKNKIVQKIISEGLKNGDKVALKFMKHKDQFIRELRTRDMYFDDQYVIGILHSYNAENSDTDNVDFRDDAVAKGFADYPYCVVMHAADENLKTIIDSSNIVSQDWDEIRRICRCISLCLSHMHAKRCLHGDVKPMNIVSVGRELKLIDLDASANIAKGEFSGSKVSSLYCPPELIYMSSQTGRFSVKIPEKDVTGVFEFSSHDYLPVVAKSSHDMWSLGVLLYYLVTGSSLFKANNIDNIDNDRDLKDLFEWTDAVKSEKLDAIQLSPILSGNEKMYFMKTARNLMSLLLQKSPDKRPSAQEVLDHPFISGKRVTRMRGDAPLYDVFLSYRVASDSEHVELIYNKLTSLGLKVWWDKRSLKSGKLWEDGFCDGLVNSAYFVCLLSRNGINHMEKHWQNFGKLAKDSDCDNVFLEWRLALELNERGLLNGIYPIFIGDHISGDSIYSNYFSNGCHCSNLFEGCVDAVEKKVREHLDRSGLGYPYKVGKEAGVAKSVEIVCDHQGGFLEGARDTALDIVVSKIVEMLHPAENLV